MKKKDFKFFTAAKNELSRSTHPRIHIGAVIVSKNVIIGRGTNFHKSHPLQKKFSRFRHRPDNPHHYMHAEVAAIVNAGTTDLSGCSMYIYREDKRGNIAICRPCPSCMALIKAVGIKTIYYTTEEGFCKEIIF